MNACLAFFLTHVMTNSIDGTACLVHSAVGVKNKSNLCCIQTVTKSQIASIFILHIESIVFYFDHNLVVRNVPLLEAIYLTIHRNIFIAFVLPEINEIEYLI